MLRNKLIVLAFALPIAASLVFASGSSYADGNGVLTKIDNKARLQGLSECAQLGIDKKAGGFKNQVTLLNFKGTASILGGGDKFLGGYSDNYPLPGLSSNKTNCSALISGSASIYNRIGGNATPPTSASSMATITKWLTTYGGYKTGSGSYGGARTGAEAGAGAGAGAASGFAGSGGTQGGSASKSLKCFTTQMTKMFSPQEYGTSKPLKSDEICFEISNNVVTNAIINDKGGYERQLIDALNGSGTLTGTQFYYDASTGAITTPPANITGVQDGDTFIPNPEPVVVKGLSYDNAKEKVKDLYQAFFRFGMATFPRRSGGNSGYVVADCNMYSLYSGFAELCEYDYSGDSDYGIYFAAFKVVDNSASGDGSGEDTVVDDATIEYTIDHKWKAVAFLTGFKEITASGYSASSIRTAEAQHAQGYNTYLSESERIQLYMYYFNDSSLIDAQVTCQPTDEEKNTLSEITWLDETNPRKFRRGCYARVGTNKTLNDVVLTEVRGKTGPFYRFKNGSTIGLDGLLAFFQTLDPNTVLDFDGDDPSAYTNTDVTNPEDMQKAEDEEVAEQQRNCYDSAGSSNWIACPIIENGTSASTVMYDFIENMLQVNTTLFSTENKVNGAFDAWGSFRNIANIVFIIIFIIVIISQVTGVGIDNYGIKKILPKLILGALLVNISFFVCQASVDVANITGGGIKNLLDGITNRMAGNNYAKFAFNQAQGVQAATGWTAAALLVAIVAAAWYFSGGSILVPILLGVIAVIIGIVFLLILLAVRQGLAVILVVISPLAFIAYMLPNTKGLFSKWIKLFSATLLAYPMCSLVIYGGQMVSTILLLAAGDGKVTNFALALTAAILSIAPVFFIPSLIMKSMNGISTVANGLKAKATNLGKSAFDRSHTADNMRNVAAARKDNLNARSARRALNRYKDDNSLTGRARKRAARNVLLGIDKKNADYYAGEARGMSKGDLVKMGNEAFGADGSFDNEKYDAALAQLFNTGNDEDALKLMSDVSNRAAAANLSGEVLEKIKSTNAQRGGTIGKALSKVQGKAGRAVSLSSAMADGKMAEAFAGMGSNAVAGMSKDEMSFLANNFSSDLSKTFANGGSMFTAEQLAAAAATHTSGKAGDNFNSLLKATGASSMEAVKSKMSAEQWAKANTQTLETLFKNDSGVLDTAGLDEFNNKMAQSIINSGDGELMSTISGEKQKAAIKAINDANAASAAAKAQIEMQARDSQQRFQQRVARTMEEIKNNTSQHDGYNDQA